MIKCRFMCDETAFLENNKKQNGRKAGQVMKKLILNLSFLSRWEDVVRYISETAGKYGTVRRIADNIAVEIGMPEVKRHIMFDAHYDEIGLIVTGIDNSGFLQVSACGGIDRRILLGHEVVVHGRKDFKGIICCQPPHLTSSSDYKKAPKVSDIAIDIGLSANEAKVNVSIGDSVNFYSGEACELLSGRITGKALDNRAGVAALIRVAELLDGKILPDTKVTLLFSAQEELGKRGAVTGAYEIDPDEAIVVDASFNATPGCDVEHCGKMSEGPMIGISPILSRKMTERLKKLADKYQLEIMAEETGTNADVISISRSGIPTAMLSIPLSYMHTAVEIIDTADVEATAQLLAKYALNGGEVNA